MSNLDGMSNLVGTWELVEWTATVGVRRQRPFRGAVEGRLTYTEDGYMWAALMRRGRRQLNAVTLAGATATERAAAAAGYINYSGRYVDLGDSVVHHVELSLMPNWVGTEQKRHISWIDRDLCLSTPAERGRGGEEILNHLRWRRAKPA